MDGTLEHNPIRRNRGDSLLEGNVLHHVSWPRRPARHDEVHLRGFTFTSGCGRPRRLAKAASVEALVASSVALVVIGSDQMRSNNSLRLI